MALLNKKEVEEMINKLIEAVSTLQEKVKELEKGFAILISTDIEKRLGHLESTNLLNYPL